jgi:hypothetical protein
MIKQHPSNLHTEIDDYLPLGKDGSLLCAHMLPSNDFWAALLEKAVSGQAPCI